MVNVRLAPLWSWLTLVHLGSLNIPAWTSLLSLVVFELCLLCGFVACILSKCVTWHFIRRSGFFHLRFEFGYINFNYIHFRYVQKLRGCQLRNNRIKWQTHVQKTIEDWPNEWIQQYYIMLPRIIAEFVFDRCSVLFSSCYFGYSSVLVTSFGYFVAGYPSTKARIPSGKLPIKKQCGTTFRHVCEKTSKCWNCKTVNPHFGQERLRRNKWLFSAYTPHIRARKRFVLFPFRAKVILCKWAMLQRRDRENEKDRVCLCWKDGKRIIAQ